MSVTMYQTEPGLSLWKVYVNVRSKLNHDLRAQRRLSGFKTQKEAEREELRLFRECEREILEKESQGESWGNLVDAYHTHLVQQMNSGAVKETTQVDYVSALKRHTQLWWKRAANSINKADLRETLNQLKAGGYSVSHLKRLKVIVNRAFTFGIENRLVPGLDQSPAIGIDLGREEEKKPEILTLKEIRRLLEAARDLEDPWYPIWALAVLTGMRNGELYALEWSDVDFENKKISVNKSYDSRFRRVKGTKAGYWRDVPVSAELRGLLDNLKSESLASGRKHVLPRHWKWDVGMQARELRRFCSGLGIPSIRFHALRACFATQLIRNGVPPIQIQKICGWRDLKTMQRYIRLAGIEVDGATEVLKVLPGTEVLGQIGKDFSGPAKTEGATEAVQHV